MKKNEWSKPVIMEALDVAKAQTFSAKTLGWPPRFSRVLVSRCHRV